MPTFNEHSAIDPANYDPRKAWIAAKNLMRRMCELNSVPVPEFFEETMFDQGPGSFGYYRPGVLYVNVENCALPVRRRPVRRYSYTGWKADRTVPGVAAHELGHHFDEFYGDFVSMHIDWHNIIKMSPKTPISGYEPSASEAFAETFRLFMLNPDFLKRAWPERYNYLRKDLGLRRIVKASMEDVLMNAHPWYIEHAYKLIVKAERRMQRRAA